MEKRKESTGRLQLMVWPSSERVQIAALWGKHAIQVERQDDVLGGSLEVVADGVLVARVQVVELRGLFGRRGRGVVGRRLSGRLGAGGGLLLGPGGGSRGLGGNRRWHGGGYVVGGVLVGIVGIVGVVGDAGRGIVRIFVYAGVG